MGITEVRFAAQPMHSAAPKGHANTLLAPLFGQTLDSVQCSRTAKHADALLKTASVGNRLSIKA
jgi:hypothetical protein